MKTLLSPGIALCVCTWINAAGLGSACTPRAQPSARPGPGLSSPKRARPWKPKIVTRTFTSGKVTIAARIVGDGPHLLVTLHGGPGLSHHYMRPLEKLATPKLRVVTYDQRGVGASRPLPLPATHHTLAGHVADLEALRAGLGAPKMHLLAHSWGGLVVLAYAIKHPARVASVVLVDALPADGGSWLQANRAFTQRAVGLIAQGLIPKTIPKGRGGDCSPRLLAILPNYYHDPRHPATRHLGGSSCHDGVLQTTWRNIGRFDLRPQLKSYRAPTLILHGKSDPFGLGMAKALGAALGASKPTTVLFDKCGHIPWEECPQPFHRAVHGFLARQLR